MAVRDGLLITRDFNTSPGETWVVDVPDGYTIAVISCHNITLSDTGVVGVKLSNEGTIVDLDIRVFVASSASAAVLDAANGAIAATSSGTSGLYGNLMMWNLNTLAPVTSYYENMTSGYLHRTAMWKSAASYNQLTFYHNQAGKTIDSGIIYVQLYKRPNTVVVQDFGADPLNKWTLTGFTEETASAILFSSYNLTLNGDATISARVSTDGISFDSGADYRVGWVNTTSDGAVITSTAVICQTSDDPQGFSSLFLGLPVASRTLTISYDHLVIASEALLSMGNREALQVEVALEVFAGGGKIIDGGVAYAVKYKF